MRRFRTNCRRGLLSTTLVSVLLVVGISHPAKGAGTNTKVYSGAQCIPTTIDSDLAQGEAAYTHAGTVVNRSSTHALNLVCPAIRDTGTLLFTGSVHIVDGSQVTDVICNFIVTAPNGNVIDSHTLRSNSSFTMGLPLDFNHYLRSVGGQPDSSVSFHCALPPNAGGRTSKLVSYSVTEYP